MERIALFFKLKPGCQGEYKKRHDNIWPEVEQALDEAGIHNYSIWNYEEILFGCYEVENNQAALKILKNNSIYNKWRDYMEDIIRIDDNTG